MPLLAGEAARPPGLGKDPLTGEAGAWGENGEHRCHGVFLPHRHSAW